MSKRERRIRPRAWTVILVPSHPGAATRQVAVSLRTVVGIGATVLALVAATVTWTSATSSVATSTADRLAESQRTVLTLLDSVQQLGALAVRATHLPPRDMVMPVDGEITSAFSESRLHPILGIFRAHRGVDVAAPVGTQIVATAAGRVRSVGWRLDYGLTVEIEHSGDVVTRYAHCSASLVHPGDHVNAGDVIAKVGTSGLTTGPHVHFEVIMHGTPVDPIEFLAASREPPAPDRVQAVGR